MHGFPWIALAALAALGCSEPAPAPAAKASDQPDLGTVAQTGEPRTPDAGPPPAPASPVQLGMPALIEFSRDACIPCQLMRPWVEELRARHAGDVAVIEVNIDRPENDSLGQFFKVAAVPLQVYLDAQGREVSRNTGLATLAQMEGELSRLRLTKK